MISNGSQRGWVRNVTSGGSEQLVTNTNYTMPTDYVFSSNLRLLNRTNIPSYGVRKIGRTKLSIDGVLAFDLIPCLTKDGEYTMWNAATGEFANKVGTFTGGMW